LIADILTGLAAAGCMVATDIISTLFTRTVAKGRVSRE
jgi:hypothetical protein